MYILALLTAFPFVPFVNLSRYVKNILLVCHQCVMKKYLFIFVFLFGCVSDGVVLKDSIKTNYTDNLSVMSMTTKFTDPEDVFLQLSTLFAYDPGRTGITLLSAEEKVFNLMKSFFKGNVSKFGGIFRKSNLLADIDD